MAQKLDRESFVNSLITNTARPGFFRALFTAITTDRSTSARASQPSNPGRTIAVVAAIALVGVTVVVVLEALAYPWARSLTGGPTLVGEWQGALTTATGHHRAVRFVVEPPGRECSSCPSVSGTARVCDERGDMSDYEAWGNTADWRGTRFSLKTRKVEDRPVGLKLGALEGEWSGDTLRLSTKLRADPDTSTIRGELDARGKEITTVIGAHADTLAPVTFTLRRASEEDFVATCGRLRVSPKR